MDQNYNNEDYDIDEPSEMDSDSYKTKEPQNTKFDNFLEGFGLIFKFIFILLPIMIIFAVIGFTIVKWAFSVVF
jgi:hypothetical protein